MALKELISYFEILKERGIDYVPVKNTRLTKLIEHEQHVKNCKKCPLYTTRHNVVFGEGNLNASLMFIGEAPGAQEDLQGKPFIGEAGKLLTKIISAMKMSRKDVYIANILKCRPPKNRDPNREEIENCLPYLIEQINLINPKIICALGKISAQTLLNTDAPISKIRGKIYDFNGIKVIPTFHPSHLLHHPENKKYVWHDMQLIMKLL